MIFVEKKHIPLNEKARFTLRKGMFYNLKHAFLLLIHILSYKVRPFAKSK